jgi:H+/gluconate symporter-like permease
MASISATTVQKTFKAETTSVFCRASISGSLGAPVLITANGASKGILSINTGSGTPALETTSSYVVKYDTSVPVRQFLGAHSIQYISGSTTGAATTPLAARVVSETTSSATAPAQVVINFYDANGDIKVLPTGSIFCLTTHLTPSNVY